MLTSKVNLKQYLFFRFYNHDSQLRRLYSAYKTIRLHYFLCWFVKPAENLLSMRLTFLGSWESLLYRNRCLPSFRKSLICQFAINLRLDSIAFCSVNQNVINFRLVENGRRFMILSLSKYKSVKFPIKQVCSISIL